jgi:uncharacterized cupredoxin-like copper-binding protein
MIRTIAAGLALAFAAALPAAAHGDKHSAPRKAADVVKEQKPWGIAADRRQARRTIEVRMTDDMRFSPDRIEVREGEVVRFVIHNAGKVMHEMVIGTQEELDQHAVLMMKHPGMEHDEPYMAHVAPGKRGEMVWNFNRPGEFQFACLIAGHYQAGMWGTITVKPAPKQGNKS